MQACPHIGRLPVAQPSPAPHARAADLGRQHLPQDARAQDKEEGGQGSTVIDPRLTTFGLGGLQQQERLNGTRRALEAGGLGMPNQRTHAGFVRYSKMIL
jgi:hypothetical protein